MLSTDFSCWVLIFANKLQDVSNCNSDVFWRTRWSRSHSNIELLHFELRVVKCRYIINSTSAMEPSNCTRKGENKTAITCDQIYYNSQKPHRLPPSHRHCHSKASNVFRSKSASNFGFCSKQASNKFVLTPSFIFLNCNAMIL